MFNKKLVLCVTLIAGALGLATSAFASVSGGYLGAQGGYGYTHYNNSNNQSVNNTYNTLSTFTTSSSNSTTTVSGGFAGRLFAGYQIDPTWGVELGFTQFSNEQSKQTASSTVGGVSDNYGAKTTIKTHAFDLVAKGTLPIEDGFSLYAKAGLAYVNAKSNNTAYSNPKLAGIVAAPNASDNRILPTGSLGVQYDLTPQLAADLSYTRIQKTGHTRLIQSTNFVGLGLAYHFG